IIFVLGPLLLLVLLLIGPFALVLTFLLARAVAASLIAVLVAVIAMAYRLIRDLHADGMRATGSSGATCCGWLSSSRAWPGGV
ncbi:MAG: hypothetical protein ACTHQQ_07750, partial [Solirubrobacteraceae bacterium]